MEKWLKDLLKKKEEARSALKEKGKNSDSVEEVRSIGNQIEDLDSEINEIRSKLEELQGSNGSDQREDQEQDEFEERSTPEGQLNPLGTYGMAQAEKEEKRSNEDLVKKYETRGAQLKEKRSVSFDIDEMPEFRTVSLGSSDLVVEKKYSNTLNPTFNEVSSLIDKVNAIPLNGGESYEKGFEISSGEGDYTTEQGDYAEAEPQTGYVTMSKAKITAYAEMTDESTKLPNVNYQALVRTNIGKALRKKATKQIITGAGGANALTGIFNAPTNVMPTDGDIEISAIDADTLDKIVFGFGGDEDVEGGAYLVLNKQDLAAFASVKSTDGKKIYKIKKNGNEGTISSDGSFEVPFIINSACPALSASATDADTFCMAYGMVQAYEMPIFSPVEVEESRDYKFRSGQIAYRGSVWAGGNVAMYKGFTRIKKVATP
ncbi:phage major capsid protein [Gracilibacillus saliphilus]|uniref:phage major capsid protein n=1 Tax=Gracilibacillus saliphilus TaxID=543890 RepID=UPI0013D7EF8D|nr:phage major capsid protein [Gracilibacillus saliphilus]